MVIEREVGDVCNSRSLKNGSVGNGVGVLYVYIRNSMINDSHPSIPRIIKCSICYLFPIFEADPGTVSAVQNILVNG